MLLMGGKRGQEILPLRSVSIHYTHLSNRLSSSWLYHDPLLHAFLDPWFACILFFCCFVLWLLESFVWLFCFSCPSLFYLFVPCLWLDALPVCVCVLSLPVQCWSLSYGKQRRPFRLCAPTWLRQQVWRTFNFFSTWTLFCYSFLAFCF